MAAVGPAFAQLTPEGRITGRVVDNQGAPLPGVCVEATSPKLVGKAVAVTDARRRLPSHGPAFRHL
ncbi:MAG: carboxypeptidase-like regulatory domain-containing protein [Candidatus Moduliflexus flocculans]|nr:carboxypeptidase-like regulatory domain-containing protein [Candidatus Moduliflexus flocculans]